jgi:branched-chain amino acid aminotransferase
MLQIARIRSSQPRSAAEREAILRDPGFGKHFTDHMATVDWTSERGWHNAQVRPRAPFSIDPASAVLHYAQEIFEGMKAYRDAGGRITFFRPDENAKRFQRSAERMAMPVIPADLFLETLQALVETDRDWVPGGDGSLYLRPFLFADEAFLGVRPSNSYKFCIIASPVGSYFKGGAKPISVWVSEEYSRAAKGGTGHAKCGGNYAGSLVAQAVATEHGCDQVIFLDAAEGRWIEELGGMNVFFVMADGTLLTPPLGTVLPGITRDSVITLARDRGLTVREDRYEFAQWQADAASGRLREAFACGTAATIAPIGLVKHGGGAFHIQNGGVGEVTASLRSTLLGIQKGTETDPHGWVRSLDGLAA